MADLSPYTILLPALIWSIYAEACLADHERARIVQAIARKGNAKDRSNVAVCLASAMAAALWWRRGWYMRVIALLVFSLGATMIAVLTLLLTTGLTPSLNTLATAAFVTGLFFLSVRLPVDIAFLPLLVHLVRAWGYALDLLRGPKLWVAGRIVLGGMLLISLVAMIIALAGARLALDQVLMKLIAAAYEHWGWVAAILERHEALMDKLAANNDILDRQDFYAGGKLGFEALKLAGLTAAVGSIMFVIGYFTLKASVAVAALTGMMTDPARYISCPVAMAVAASFILVLVLAD